ncbi:MAG: hypothetical protein H6707_20555 [Deltaproteobacteria bacterium]|nr:hypothetical protein [Deltaproteobacteria bacterium]
MFKRLLIALLVLFPTQSWAEDATARSTARVQIEIGIEVASIYNNRGLNAFAAGQQRDQHMMLAPSIAFAFAGFTVQYWSAYQWLGENQADLVAEGVGHEQQINLSYAFELTERWGLALGLSTIFYPFAGEQSAGTSVPVCLEPYVTVNRSGWADLSLTVLYSGGVQKALAEGRYTYINPTLEKKVPLNGSIELALGLGVGVKIYDQFAANKENVVDVAMGISLPIALGKATLSPGVNWAWTNLKQKNAAEEQMLWGSLAITLGI